MANDGGRGGAVADPSVGETVAHPVGMVKVNVGRGERVHQRMDAQNENDDAANVRSNLNITKHRVAEISP